MPYVIRISGPVETAGLYLTLRSGSVSPYGASEREFATRFNSRSTAYEARNRCLSWGASRREGDPERLVRLRVEPLGRNVAQDRARELTRLRVGLARLKLGHKSLENVEKQIQVWRRFGQWDRVQAWEELRRLLAREPGSDALQVIKGFEHWIAVREAEKAVEFAEFFVARHCMQGTDGAERLTKWLKERAA